MREKYAGAKRIEYVGSEGRCYFFYRLMNEDLA